MDERERLLNYIENMDLTYLVQFLLGCEATIQKWKCHERNKKFKEPEPGSIEDRIVRAFSGPKMSKEEEESLKASYKVAKVMYQLLENDEEVIKALARRINQIDYDENSEEKRAEIVCSIASLLKIKLSLYQGNSWESVQEEIADTLETMTPRDFLTTFELSGRNYIFRNELYNDVLVEKISEMTEPEFIRYLYDTSDGMGGGYANTNLARRQKVREGSAGLAPKYLRLCENSEEALEIIEKAENNGVDILEIIIETEKFMNNSEIELRVSELVKKLSTMQIVKYLINRSNTITFTNKVENMMLDRLEELSDNEMDTLLNVYRSSVKRDTKDRIIQVAVKKGIMFKREENEYYATHNLYTDEISKRIGLYRATESPVASLRTALCSNNLLESEKTVLEKDGIKENEDIIEKIVEKFELDDLEIDTTEGMISYIAKLQTTSDMEMIPLIMKMNREMQNKKSHSTTGMQDIRDTKIMILKEEAAKQLHAYINNRILNMNSPKAITLLSMAYTKNGIFNDAIEECIDQFNKEQRKIKKDEDENPGSFDPR